MTRLTIPTSRRGLRAAFGAMLGVVLLAPAADAQWYYPRGYGGYGWGGWGADPASGYMAGLGSYARGQGVYEVEDAKARAINLDTMIKWNKALRERQKALRAEQRKEDAQRAAERDARATEQSIEDGTTLNDLLARIYDFDPAAAKATRAGAVIGADAVREIPFSWDTEAITVCIDQMTATDALPSSLAAQRFVNERNALRQAVDAALKEEAKGDVSPAAKKRVASAITAFRAKFTKEVPDFDASYMEAEQYFITLGSLTRMLNDPSMRKILAQLSAKKDVPVGDLIAFMHSYNLRFAPATTARQIEIYRGLVGLFKQVAEQVTAEAAPAAGGDRDGKRLQSAAKDAFRGMSWKHLDAQNQEP
jgi:hypothetical protein